MRANHHLPTKRKRWHIGGIDVEVFALFKEYCEERGFAMCRALDYLMEECMTKKLIIQLSRLPYNHKKPNPRQTNQMQFNSGKNYRQFKAYCVLRDIQIRQAIEFLMIRAIEEKPNLGIRRGTYRKPGAIFDRGKVQ